MRQRTAIILVHYKNVSDTIECLRSLRRVQFCDMVVILVDNDCGTSTALINQSQEEFPGLYYVRSGENLGFAAGNNLGIQKALELGVEYVLLLNNDTVVELDFLEPLVKALEANPSAGAAGGLICSYANRDVVWYGGGDFDPWRMASYTRFVKKQVTEIDSSEVRQVSFITGCLMLVRAHAFRKVGLLDERFFMYHEDAEFSLRLKRCGYDLLFVPSSKIYHKADHMGEHPFHVYYSIRNRLLLGKIATKGVMYVVGFVYVAGVLTIKLCWWRLCCPNMFRAAVEGVRDYYGGTFHKGSGPSFAGLKK